jgi:hypothetical protein
MRMKFIRTLVAVLAAIAVCVFVYPDDLWGDDAGDQSEMMMQSPDNLATHPDQHAIDSSFLTALGDSTRPPSSAASTTPTSLVSLSVRVLRC